MSYRSFRSRPKWAMKDFFKDAELDGYAGVGPYRWWRGNYEWAAGFLWNRVIEEPGRGPRSRTWCQYPWRPTPRRRAY